MSYKKLCDCEDFEKGMSSLTVAQDMAFAHGWRYEGVMFKFCPWCGKELIKLDYKD